MKKLLFIYNPTAGRGLIKLHLYDIIDIFARGGYDVLCHPTGGTLDAFDAAECVTDDIGMIVVSGGDGTLGEVIKGLMSAERDIPLGYIPAGTMNDFAACHGISKNMTEAAEMIIDGEPRRFDIGVFEPLQSAEARAEARAKAHETESADTNAQISITESVTDTTPSGEYFTYVAAFGAFTGVSYETSRQMKNMFGPLAYVMKGLTSIGSIKPSCVTVTHDGYTITDDFFFGMAANSTSVGGMKGITGDDVSLNDGLFECVFVRAVPSSQIAMLVSAVMSHDFDSEYIVTFKTRELTISSETPLPFTLDGERGGEYERVCIRCIKEAITVIV